MLFCPQWGGRAIEKPVLLVGGGRVPASTAHRQWSQEMQSQRAVPSGHALCGGRSVNLSRTNSKLPVMMMTHLARIHGPPYYAPWRNVVGGVWWEWAVDMVFIITS